jgi:putative DNA methylase
MQTPLTAAPHLDNHFDTTLANQLALFETYNKHHYRPNTYLHKWWARRCGSTFRLLLKHLVDDPDGRDYYAAGGLDGKIILDPMMGGGTTIHEAIRLGANVIGADIDPIPSLQVRATLSKLPLVELQKGFSRFLKDLQAALSHLYQTNCPDCHTAVPQRYTLYALRRRCACGQSLFVDSLNLRHETDGTTIHIDPLTHNIFRDGLLIAASTAVQPLPIHERSQQSCAQCGENYQEMLAVPYYGRYTPIAIVAKCPQHSLFFTAPQTSDWEMLQTAASQRPAFSSPDFLVPPGPKSDSLPERGIPTYLDLFSSRQLLFLQKAIELVSDYAPLVRLNLALLVSTSLEFNSMLCGYKGAGTRRAGAIRHTFTYHAYTFPYTAVENNPIYPDRASGSLQNLFASRIGRGRKWALRPIERRLVAGKTTKVTIDGETDNGTEVYNFADLVNGRQNFLLLQGSSTRLDLPSTSVDYIVTDPPYFDSVQYSDLAAFFRVWLQQLLPTDSVETQHVASPHIASPHVTSLRHYSMDDSAVKLKSNGNGTGQYRRVLSGIFVECARVLKDNGRLIFTFHHWKPKGWADLTIALKRAGFHLVNHYVVHAENPVSVHIVNQDVMLHDLILVLAKQPMKAWQLPETIQLQKGNDAFVKGCGTAVGYFLNSTLPDDDIETQWQQKLPF